MARQVLNDQELGGVQRPKINQNFEELYGRVEALEFTPSVQPSLILDFENNDYRVVEEFGLVPKTIDQVLTTTNGVATRIDHRGLIVPTAVNQPRINWPSGWPRLITETQRTRLNTIAAEPVSAENISVTAAAHTVSFYGSGSIVLTGVYSATLSGVSSGRATLTFTPTAGVLTITPAGTVTDLQLELGGAATSVIRGEGSAIVRIEDNLTRFLGNEFNTSGEGAIFFSVDSYPTVGGRFMTLGDGTLNNRIEPRESGSNWIVNAQNTANIQVPINPAIEAGPVKVLYKWEGLSFKVFINSIQRSSVTLPAPFVVAEEFRVSRGQGVIQQTDLSCGKILYFPKAPTDSECLLLTKV